jgi:hypothetical protein
MSNHEGNHRLTADIAAAASAGHDRLASLLTAASAPGRPDELVGLEAALTAFRAASHDLVPQLRRWQMIKAWIAKFVTVKVVALCVATMGLGGVAVAASTGNLPGPLHLGSAPETRPTVRPTDLPSRGTDHTPAPPGLQKLCRDYLGKDHDHRREALGDQAFHELVDRIGARDRDKADSFCDKMVHDGPSTAPSATRGPGGADQFPTPRPTGTHGPTPTVRPTGRPGAVPTPGSDD